MTRSPAEIMTALARQFPVLKKAPGVDPWEPAVIDERIGDKRVPAGVTSGRRKPAS